MTTNNKRLTIPLVAALFVLISCADTKEMVVEVEALYDDPQSYAGKTLAVRGSLVWHSDEPVLLPLGVAAKKSDFQFPVHLENPQDIDLSPFDREDVELAGTFHYRDFPESPDFTGWIRVEHITLISDDR